VPTIRSLTNERSAGGTIRAGDYREHCAAMQLKRSGQSSVQMLVLQAKAGAFCKVRIACITCCMSARSAISTGSVSDLVELALALSLSRIEPRPAGTAGILARSERFSAKYLRCVATQVDVINSTQSLTKGVFAPIGAHRGREATRRRCSAGDPATPALPGSASRYNFQGAAAYSTRLAIRGTSSCGL
jgi:hypothetical protein